MAHNAHIAWLLRRVCHSPTAQLWSPAGSLQPPPSKTVNPPLVSTLTLPSSLSSRCTLQHSRALIIYNALLHHHLNPHCTHPISLAPSLSVPLSLHSQIHNGLAALLLWHSMHPFYCSQSSTSSHTVLCQGTLNVSCSSEGGITLCLDLAPC